MSDLLLVVPLALPLLVAGALVLLRGTSGAGSPVAARWAGVATTGSVAVVAGLLLRRTLAGEVPAVQVGGWAPGLGIPLAADPFAAVVLLAVSLVVLAGLVHAAGTGEDAAPALVPLVLVMSAGTYGALLAADLFNLFVLVEVMLVPSYVLLVLGRRRTRARLAAARLYVAVNLLASTVFLVGTGLVYAAAGTVQLGELAALVEAGGATPSLQVAVWLLLLSMGVKCAAVPLHGWLPRSYAVAGPAVVAVFSALLTKTGLVVLVRLDALLVPDGSAVPQVVLVVGLLSAVVGVLLAVGEKGARAVLTSHMVSQVGYLLAGLGLATALGLAALVVFLVQYVLVKAALLMVAGAVETRRGTDRLDRLGGLARREPVLATAFALGAAGLVGLPPTSGFVAKLALVTAAVDTGAWATAGVLVAVSLLTLTSMLKLWNGIFWGETETAPAGAVPPPGAGRADDADGEPADRGTRARRAALVGPPLVLAAGALVLGVAAEPLLVVADAAARALADPSPWVAAVTGGAP